MRCALGKSGITAFKREGGGATPLARMRLVSGYVKSRLACPRPAGVPMAQIHRGLGWCDAVFDPNYNRPVRFPYRASAENMLRTDTLYDVCLVLDWNFRRRCQGRGSAIFFHLALPGYPPTHGCIAVSRRDMARLLPFLSTKTGVLVVR